MKQNVLCLTAVTTAAAILLTGCGTSNGATSTAPTSSVGGAEQKSLKFSFVQNNADWIESGEVQSRVCVWDEVAGTTQEVASLKTPYPCEPVYCPEDGSVLYYATRPDVDSENNNLLCAYDTRTGETKTLLNGDEKEENGKQKLYGIDYITPLDDHQLYMTAGTGSGVIAPVSYDLTSGELTKWDWDSDFPIWRTTKDPWTGTIYISGSSEKEEFELMKQLNDRKIEEFGQSCTIYALSQDGGHEAVYTSKDWSIDDFVVHDSTILCAQTRFSLDKSKHRIVTYDMVNKTETEVFADKKVDGTFLYLDDGGSSLYVENGGLVKINLSTGKETILYTPGASKPAVEFSNAQVLS